MPSDFLHQKLFEFWRLKGNRCSICPDHAPCELGWREALADGGRPCAVRYQRRDGATRLFAWFGRSKFDRNSLAAQRVSNTSLAAGAFGGIVMACELLTFTLNISTVISVSFCEFRAQKKNLGGVIHPQK